MSAADKPVVVELLPQRSYAVKFGDKTLDMRVTGEWEGMTRLQGDEGQKLIVEFCDGTFSKAWLEAAANEGGTPLRATIVKASPALLDLLGRLP